MKNIKIHIKVNENLYLKDPESSRLGKKIISNSILLIDKLGFESFTFKKLATKIGSTESSIYRYFESKNAILLYLYLWYWSWIEYKLVFGTVNTESAEDRLKKAIKIISSPIEIDNDTSHINEIVLQKIIISESIKVTHSKEVDEENEKGHYKVYKRVIKRISGIINEINPNYPFPGMLAFNLVDGSVELAHFSSHVTGVTEMKSPNDSCLIDFYTDIIFKALK